MSDPTDDLIEALCTAREHGLSRVESQDILRDLFDAPWSTATVHRFVGKRKREAAPDPSSTQQVQQ